MEGLKKEDLEQKKIEYFIKLKKYQQLMLNRIYIYINYCKKDISSGGAKGFFPTPPKFSYHHHG